MPHEIERKYLLASEGWRDNATSKGETILQGYLETGNACTVRVRLAGERGFVTIKGKTNAATPLTREEFEYEIPVKEARAMLTSFCEERLIEKTRFHVLHKGHVWEVDCFQGANKGLVLAEIELKSENESFERPDWLGREVSYEEAYKNTELARNGFCPQKDKLNA